jgi:D-alanyl-D-alanine carboxypeptidase (penicillin-binding protein 5/6)
MLPPLTHRVLILRAFLSFVKYLLFFCFFYILSKQFEVLMRLFLFFFFISSISFLYAKPLQVEVSARSAILMNAETGAILFEKQAHLPAYPASTTKIGTALFVLDEKEADLRQSVLISEEALRMKSSLSTSSRPYWLEVDGTMMGLRKGEVLSLEALLHGMMMVSGNDAANAIAESQSGSIPEFMQEMNGYLNRLGCKKTVYLNPHGLHHPEHVTTAYDLALMMKRGLAIPKFRELISKISYFRPKSNKSSKEEIITFNQLMKPGKYHYPKSIGGKTGYHSQSMATLTAAAHHQGRTLIVVVLGCSKISRYEDAKRLFEAAFQEELVHVPLLTASQLFSQQIEGAETRLMAQLQEPLSVSYFLSEEPLCRAFVHWGELTLPIRKGQIVGEVRVVDQTGLVLAKAPLLSQIEINGTWPFRMKRWLSKLQGF